MRIDLNADMGESYGRWTLGDDGALMPYLTSANIACGRLQHVKPHGALYTSIVDSPEHAEAAARAVAALGGDVILLMPPAVAGAAAAAGVPFVAEGYVDLDYDAHGRLVLERAKQLRDPDAMGARAVRLA